MFGHTAGHVWAWHWMALGTEQELSGTLHCATLFPPAAACFAGSPTPRIIVFVAFVAQDAPFVNAQSMYKFWKWMSRAHLIVSEHSTAQWNT